ncbi:hypothetical protein [Terrabacter sp. 2YAF2]|uniref:hypothetical protein n=1 Tax=Terrabacter sp. 2YAF2 TaxID=3233026 RepID=UPI003F9C8A80
MPYAPETARWDRSGTSKVSNEEQVANLFAFEPLYLMGEIVQDLLDQHRTRGRRANFPATLLLGVAVSARITTSVPESIRLLENGQLWDTVRYRFHEMTGHELPAGPPNKDQVDHFRERILQLGAMPLLQAMFRRCAIAQAWAHGNLLPGNSCDFTQPDDRNAIYGDGTLLKAFSNVRTITDPYDPTRRRLVGSRASDPKRARVQNFTTDLSQDDKSGRGVNFVSVHTWTQYGRVVLGTAPALGAEQWAALELIEAVGDLAGGGMHHVIWDRAITGWTVDYIMAKYGAQVLGKSVAQREITDQTTSKSIYDKSGDGPDHDDTAEDLGDPLDDGAWDELPAEARFVLDWKYVTEKSRRLAAELGAKPGTQALHVLRQDHLAARYHSGRPLPVGTNLYETSRLSYDAVYGKTYWPSPVSHTTATGVCEHRIVTDDGSLYLVGYDPELDIPVKEQHLPCLSSIRSQGAGEPWQRTSTYLIPCEHGDVTYTHTWAPTTHRSYPEKKGAEPDQGTTAAGTEEAGETAGARKGPMRLRKKAANPAPDVAGRELRPLGRADARFTGFFRRNDSEAFNAYVKRSMPIRGRAASVTLEGQEFDVLAAGMVNNSLTMSRSPLA